MKKGIFPIVLIILFSFFIFRPTFNLSFFGDDWLLFWIDKYIHGPYSDGQWNYLSHFFTRYGSQAIAMGLQKSIFGLDPTYFYITSFATRMFMSISIYPLAFYITKSRQSALFAVLFLSITAIGLETTEYLPHIPSYIGMGFFNLFLYYYIRSHFERKNSMLIISGLFFFFAFYFALVRMTGVYVFIFIMEIIFTKGKFNKESLKVLFQHLAFIVLIFLFINFIGKPFFYLYGPSAKPESSQYLVDLSTQGFRDIQQSLQNGNIAIVFNPLITVGGMLIPDSIFSVYKPLFNSVSDTILTTLIALFIFMIICYILQHSHIQVSRLNFKITTLVGILFSFMVYLIFPLSWLQNPSYFIFVLAGGYLTIFGTSLGFAVSRQPLLSLGIFIAIVWMYLGFLIPWFWAPNTIYPVVQRYLISSTTGVVLFLSIVLSIVEKSKLRPLFIILFVFIILGNIFTSSNYINILRIRHDRQTNDQIWAAMPYIPEIKSGKAPIVFYFENDGSNHGIIHDVITFGFSPHIDLIYDLNKPQGDISPFGMTEWKDVESLVLYGKGLAAVGYPETPIPLDQVFAFRLEGTNKLVNITDQAREKLDNLKNKQ